MLLRNNGIHKTVVLLSLPSAVLNLQLPEP